MGEQSKVIWKDLGVKDRVELFCEMIGCNIPLIGGGMAWVADAPFVITVSRCIPQMLGSGTMDYEFLRDQIRIIKATLKPAQNWGVNLILFTGNEKDGPENKERLEELVDKRIDVIVEEGVVPFIATGAGVLTQPRARKLKDAGSKLIAVIGQPKHAKLARRAGYDIVVAERRRSGGHVGPMDEGLIEQTVGMVPDMPVVGAGGIGDAETFAEVLNLGACGGQIGTALIATSDTDTDEGYKQRIVKAKGPDATTVTAIDDILQVRSLKNSLTDEFHRLKAAGATRLELEELTVGSLRRAKQGGNPESSTYAAGTIAERINDIVTVEERVNSIWLPIGDYIPELGDLVKQPV